MRLEGTHLFAAPRPAVWEALMDPSVLTQALPGGEQLEQTGNNQYRAVMNVKVGPVQGRFEGKIELDELITPESYVMRVDGQGAPGFVNGEGRLQLAEQDGGTLLTYSGDVHVGGRIAGVGQRLVESTARSLTRQGLQVLDQMILARELGAQADRQGPASSSAPPVSEQTGTSAVQAGQTGTSAVQAGQTGTSAVQAGQTGTSAVQAALAGQRTGPSAASIGVQVAKDVARDLTKEYIPEDQQERVVWFSLGALTMLLFVVLVRLVQKD